MLLYYSVTLRSLVQCAACEHECHYFTTSCMVTPEADTLLHQILALSIAFCVDKSHFN